MGLPRKAKSGARYDCGKLKPTADYGPAEVRERRRALAGKHGDPALTGYPLGIMYANGVISSSQHETGCRYATLRRIVYGTRQLRAAKLDDAPRGLDLSDSDTAALERMQFKVAQIEREIKRLGERHYRELVRVVVHEETPRWLLPAVPTLMDVREANTLLDALKAMDDAKHITKPDHLMRQASDRLWAYAYDPMAAKEHKKMLTRAKKSA